MKFKFIAMAAAVAASASAAGAADLNKPAKVAVDYVKICDAYGAGFFYIPGSDTCLRVSGYIYTGFEYGVANTVARTSAAAVTFAGPYAGGSRVANTVGNYTRADERFDARTKTEYGLLRSYVDFHEDLNTSNTNAAITTVRLDRAFVQFGGLTAGRALSFYDFYLGDTFAQNYGDVSPNSPVNLIAYTFAFGNGVSATLSLEDPTTSGYVATNAGQNAYEKRRQGVTFNYGALNAPDIIGQLNVTQAWGQAQLSVAAHQDYGSAAVSPKTKWGYGVQGGVLFNVPTLGAGDVVFIDANYSVGAIGFSDWQGSFQYRTPGGVFSDLGADATYNPVTGALTQTTAWAIYGGLKHNFSPAFEFDFTAGYFSEKNNGSGRSGTVPGALGNNAFQFGQYEFEAQLQWKPIAAVQISPYTEFRTVNVTSGTANNYGLLTKNPTAVNFGLRVRRDF